MSSRDASRAALALVLGVLGVVSGAELWDLVTVWAGRWAYPFDLEWMEGGLLVHSWRMLQHQPVHVAPTVDWIPFLYPTGYPSIVAALAEIFGLSMGLARAVSLVGTLSAAAAIPYATRHLGRGWLPGLAGAVVFLATYPFSGAFMDLVRLDGVMMGLLAWSVVLLLDRRRGAATASALLLFAAFLVKHNVALVGFPLALAVWHRDGRGAALRYGLTAALPALAVVLWLDVVTAGAYLRWLLAVPAVHGFAGNRFFPGIGLDHGHALAFVGPVAAAGLVGAAWRQEITRPRLVTAAIVAVLVGAAGAAIWVPGVRGLAEKRWWTFGSGLGFSSVGAVVLVAWASRVLRSRSWRFTWALGVAATTVFMSLMMRGHVGGFVNVNMPVHWGVALGAALVLGDPVRALRRDGGSAWGMAVVGGLLAGQLVWSRANLDRESLVPTADDVAVGDALVERLAAEEGPILSPYNPWLLVLAGHDDPGFHLIALWDIDHPGGPYADVAQRVRDALAAGRWRGVLDGSRSMVYGVDDGYTRGEVWVGPRELQPKTGYRVHPARWRVPKPLDAPGPGR